ncbi:TPA: hypothetical protein ACVTHL_005477 [Bacillus cereus]|uniref:hypothetical protein n=1 Tax=Bacillus cereus TaxID=1396 RepID=UPI0007ABC5AD|nr:hypothetical protein [Bacillus cereus]KZD72329.1 hypothetical protein B4120_4760 [Bacillus cereus]
MTIITTVYVPDGIAMAADSRLTITNHLPDGTKELFTLSDNAQKIVLLRKATIGVATCGSAIIEGRTVSDLLRIFDIDKVKENDTVEEVAVKLKGFLLEKYSSYHVLFKVAGFDNDEAYVYSVSKDGVQRENYSESQDIIYGVLWDGEPKATSNLLKNTSIDFKMMPLKDAADLAEFVVDLTIKYCRFQEGLSTCGGPIDILVITKDYTKFIKHKIL